MSDTAPAAGSPETGGFGTSRGSGLARGKRPATPAAAGSKSQGQYTPTAIEVITPASTYSNPFAPAEPAPEAPAPVVEPKAEPAAPAAEAPVSESKPVEAAPEAVAPATTEAPAPAAPAAADEAPAESASLNILPPEETRRPSQSWENRPGRRDDRGPREERGPRRDDFRREDRGPRREGSSHEQRAPQPRQEAPAKKTGFIAWLKGLFGGKTEQKSQQSSHEGRGEHRGGRNRHRGGRDRGEFRGGQGQESREGGREGGQRFEGGERGGDYRGGRRRRGGRGRHHGGRDRGDFRGGDSGPQGGTPPQA